MAAGRRYVSLGRENGQEEMIIRSGIMENRGGGGIFVVLYLAGGDASHPSGAGEGGGGVFIRSGRGADGRDPSLEPRSSLPSSRGSIFSIRLLPGRSSPVQADCQRTLAVHVPNVITFPDLGKLD